MIHNQARARQRRCTNATGSLAAFVRSDFDPGQTRPPKSVFARARKRPARCIPTHLTLRLCSPNAPPRAPCASCAAIDDLSSPESAGCIQFILSRMANRQRDRRHWFDFHWLFKQRACPLSTQSSRDKWNHSSVQNIIRLLNTHIGDTGTLWVVMHRRRLCPHTRTDCCQLSPLDLGSYGNNNSAWEKLADSR